MESPVGVFIVAFGGDAEAAIRVKTAIGDALFEQKVTPFGR